jgi:hypothetical protein
MSSITNNDPKQKNRNTIHTHTHTRFSNLVVKLTQQSHTLKNPGTGGTICGQLDSQNKVGGLHTHTTKVDIIQLSCGSKHKGMSSTNLSSGGKLTSTLRSLVHWALVHVGRALIISGRNEVDHRHRLHQNVTRQLVNEYVVVVVVIQDVH